MSKRLLVLFLALVLGIFTTAWAQTIVDGGDRLVETQNVAGGWGWPLTGTSAVNTIGPITMGLAQAYYQTSDPTYLAALSNTASFLLTKQYNFSPSDGYLAKALDEIFGGNTYVNHLNTYFYGPLAAGTYNRNNAGMLYSTATYIDLIQTARHNSGIGNLAAWDIAMGLVGAARCGVTGTELDLWIAGVEDEINLLDGTGDYDVLGLAGALYGLAEVGEEFDPTAGEHAAASSIADLADILVSYQIDGGGFAWNSAYVIPNDGNETIQETAYAILALNAVDRTGYQTEIAGARDYIASVQLATGGWENYTTSGENNEITGEALWGYIVAISDDHPLPVVLSSFSATVNSTVDAVALRWVTQSETNLAGYYIYRSESEDMSEAVRINSLITGTNTSTQQEYIYNDTEIAASTTYWYWLYSVEMDGQMQPYGPVSVTIPSGNPGTPIIPFANETGIAKTFPNPFEADLNVYYSLQKGGYVEMIVANVKGQTVRKLFADNKSEGVYSYKWDARDNSGKPCPSGMYFVRMTVNNKTYSQKVYLVK
jgi:hypothetical protein